jgi:hypothetical protein
VGTFQRARSARIGWDQEIKMFRCTFRSPGSALLVCAALVVGAEAEVRADEVETRDFLLKIDGNPVGQSRMTISRRDNGSISMACQADIKMTTLGITTYRYSYRGTEVWSAGRLVEFQSSTDDDGTKYSVSGTADRGGLRLKVNGNERMVRPDVWVTSYWQLPEAKRRNGALPLLDADEGKTLTGAIRNLGAEQITVANQNRTCGHYRITGPNMVDAWFDGQDRLVREEWTERGRKIQMELTSVRR